MNAELLERRLLRYEIRTDYNIYEFRSEVRTGY